MDSFVFMQQSKWRKMRSPFKRETHGNKVTCQVAVKQSSSIKTLQGRKCWETKESIAINGSSLDASHSSLLHGKQKGTSPSDHCLSNCFPQKHFFEREAPPPVRMIWRAGTRQNPRSKCRSWLWVWDCWSNFAQENVAELTEPWKLIPGLHRVNGLYLNLHQNSTFVRCFPSILQVLSLTPKNIRLISPLRTLNVTNR